MNRTIPRTVSGSGKSGKKLFASMGAACFIAGALYLSSSPPEPEAFADSAKVEKAIAPTPGAVAAASAFLEALDATQREKALYEFGSAKKSSWSNLPVTFVPRNGVMLGDLKPEQKAKAMAVVAAVLSKDGYQKVVDIMDGDQKLADNPARGGPPKKDGPPKKEGPKGKGPMFGKDLYYLAIFGQPSDTKPWMVQFGGHHLGVNVTIIGKHFVLTPTHTGAQPSLFKRGDMEVRPLGQEIDSAHKLMDALSEKQRMQAIISDRPQQELLLGPGRDGKTIDPPRGVKGSDLTAAQQALLLDVIAAWVEIVEPDAARARMASIKEKIVDTYFAWSGSVEKGKAAYFRIQGPRVVIEYAPQGSTDHIHTIIRNPEDDYGAALIKQ